MEVNVKARVVFVVLLLSFLASCTPVCGCQPPIPPQAIAGGNQTVNVGATVNLDGSLSSAAGNSLWSFVEKSILSQAVLVQAETLTSSFTADVVGSYRVKLEIKSTTDGGLLSDEVTIIAQ
jgi:hypothetical protein